MLHMYLQVAKGQKKYSLPVVKTIGSELLGCLGMLQAVLLQC